MIFVDIIIKKVMQTSVRHFVKFELIAIIAIIAIIALICLGVLSSFSQTPVILK